MKRTLVFTGMLLATAPLAIAQQGPRAPQFPEDAMTFRTLIHWTEFQKPHPTPQPLPPDDNRAPEPDAQDQQGKQPPVPENPSTQTPTAQAFTGTIVEDGNKFVLKVANNTAYELQGAAGLERYENQNVRVVGTLDTATNTIRVVKIELLS